MNGLSLKLALYFFFYVYYIWKNSAVSEHVINPESGLLAFRIMPE